MTTNTSPKTSDAYLARNSFKKIGDWEQFSWYLRYVDVDGSPVPAAVWVKQLLAQFDYTYNEHSTGGSKPVLMTPSGNTLSMLGLTARAMPTSRPKTWRLTKWRSYTKY